LAAADLSGRIWQDDGDGVRSDAETTVPQFITDRIGTYVTLSRSGETRLAVVAANGTWSITGLAEATWTISVPVIYPYSAAGTDLGGDETRDSDFSSGGSPMVTVNTTVSTQRVFDCGLIRSHRTLWFRSWRDLNRNGQRDSGEPSISQYPELLRGDGTLIGGYPSAMEGADSSRRGYADIAPGTYRIRFVAQSGLALTVPDQGPDATDSDADPVTRMSPVVTIGSSDIDSEVDAGYADLSAKASFGAWLDRSRDGLHQAGETEPIYLSPVLEQLNGTVWSPWSSTTKGSDGRWTWTLLPAGHYRVTFATPIGYAITAANVGVDDSIDSDIDTTGRFEFDIVGAEVRADAGYLDQSADASLGAWLDRSRDGLHQTGETEPIYVSTPMLEVQNGSTWSQQYSTPTSSGGRWTWTRLLPGHYRVTYATPFGYAITAANVGSDDSIDSDIDSAGRFEFDIAGVNVRADAGYLDQSADASFGAWLDRSRDGLHQTGETEPIYVNTPMLEQQYGTTWSQLYSTPTSSGGRWTWTRLPPGHYRVTFEKPYVYAFTAANAGADDNVDSDIDASGRFEFDIAGFAVRGDAGFLDQRADASFGAWVDRSRDGIHQTGEIESIYLNAPLLEQQNGTTWYQSGTTTKGSDGRWTWAQLLPGHYRVTFEKPYVYAFTAANAGADDNVDSDIDASGRFEFDIAGFAVRGDAGFLDQRADASFGAWVDRSRDGIHQTGETESIYLNAPVLEQQNGTTWYQSGTTTKGSDGRWTWAQLLPGHYRVTFEKPYAYAFTAANVGADDSIDSDIDTAGRFEFDIAGFAVRADAGYLDQSANAAFGAWLDRSRDGLRQVGETETLLVVSPRLEVLNGAVWNPWGTNGQLDANGRWAWSKIPPGHYRATFAIPVGYILTTANAGSDDTIDSDFDAAGRVEFDIAGANVQGDAGFLDQRADASFGAWLDRSRDGVHQSGETESLTLSAPLLELQNGATWLTQSTTTTGGDGRWTWTRLLPGHYRVTYGTPAGYAFTAANAGGDDAVDSDVDGSGRFEFDIAGFAVQADAGYLDQSADASLGVWVDASRDGVRQGDETGTLPLVTPSLELLNGGTWVPSGVAATLGGTGRWVWAHLLPGHYRATLATPAGFAITTPNAGSDEALDSDIDAAGQVEFDIAAAVPVAVDAGYLDQSADASLGVWLDRSRDGVHQAGESEPLSVAAPTLEILSGTTWSPAASAVLGSDGRWQWTHLFPGHYRVSAVPPLDCIATVPDQGGDDALDSDLSLAGQAEFDIAGVAVSLDAGYLDQRGDIRLGIWLDRSEDGLRQVGETEAVPAPALLLERQEAGAWSTVGSTPALTAERTWTWSAARPGHYRLTVTAPAGYVLATPDVGSDDSLDSDVDTAGQVQFDVAGSAVAVDAGLVRVPGACAGQVWFDGDADGIRDAGEPARSGVTLRCLTPAGVEVATQVTDAQGQYLFTHLEPGSYVIEAVGLAGLVSPTDAGSDDALDSDVGQDARAAVTVLSAQTARIDAGIRNRAPVAGSTPAVVAEDGAVALAVTASDADGDAVTWSVVTAPAHGTLSGTAPALTYSPQANWSGSDAVTLRVSDAWGLSAQVTVAVTVTPVNDAPTLAALSIATTANTSAVKTLVGADVENDALTYRVVTAPTLGAVTITGNQLKFVPNANATGTETFTVAAVDPAGATGSATVTVTITGSGLPVPWALAAVGTQSPAATASYNWTSRIFTVSGSGVGLTAKADAAALLAQPISGDVTIIAKVASQVAVGSTARAGLTFRDSTAVGAREVSAVISPANGLYFLRRTTLNGTTTSTSGGTPSPARRWLRLQRVGSTMTASASVDGVTWTTIGSATVTLNAQVQVGLFSASGVSGTASAATFESVQIILPAALRANG
jgi:regulation of enolase protein 1 (concanavalin A-like superfamily)